MKVRTVRQLKHQQRPRQQKQTGALCRANDSDTINERHLSCAIATTTPTTTTAHTNLTKRNTTTNHKMPPLNESNNGNGYAEASIPGMTLMSDTPASVAAASLRTHSSKFPIERELILSSDKASSKIPLMHESRLPATGARRTLLSRQSGSIAPDHPPKQTHAWNSLEVQQAHPSTLHKPQSILSGAVSRTPARLPEDVTALADRDNVGRDRDGNKNAVSKTYHTLKDLISSKFKKDSNDTVDGLNNVVIHQHMLSKSPVDEIINPRIGSAVPLHMRQMQNFNQSQPNILASAQRTNGHQSSMSADVARKTHSQPQLNIPIYERRNSVTDSDDGGFASRTARRPQTVYHLLPPPHQIAHKPHQHMSAQIPSQTLLPAMYQNPYMPQHESSPIQSPHHQLQQSPQLQEPLQSARRFEQTPRQIPSNGIDGGNKHTAALADTGKQIPGSANSSDYDKSGNQSSNVDSGRGSAAYSSGRKAPQLDTEGSDSPNREDSKNDDSEWVDIVDAELRHILEPGMQSLSIRPESTVSGSISSISPPLPPLSPDISGPYKLSRTTKDSLKQEYGTDSYNRPGRGIAAIGPSRAGWPGSALSKQSCSYTKGPQKISGKKHEQAVLKRHLFGLDNDLTSNTTRSLDLESLLGGTWGTTQSISDSETDNTQGIRHIRSQLEGLEHMYGEVLKMLGNRNASQRMPDLFRMRGIGIRRRHGSLSSLPSSSMSSRPTRDRRRTDERRKVKDVKGINKRFQRLESHVVTLARSVAHLSSEMRSQHLVTQELERLRDEFTALSRAQTTRSQNLYRSTMSANMNDPEPPNLTNPKRVRKLTKFFGEDPPLMRLFLRSLGYEKYANLFEAERVGMIELPYLSEERLQKMGVPLGPRLRILQEAQISLCKDTTLCIV